MIVLALLFGALWCGTHANAESCPPESGIYLMHRGNCVANNSQLRNMDLVGEENGLQCLYVGLEQSMIEAEDESGTGIWHYPAGDSVKCYTSRDSSDPFECTEITNSNGSSGVNLYRLEGRFIGNKVGEYTCCLPGGCDSATGEHVTVKIFETTYISDIYATLPQDITVAPQSYTVHCVYDNSPSPSPTVQYYMEGPVAEDFCSTFSGISCTNQLNSTTGPVIDSQLSVTWDASTVIKVHKYFPFDTPSNGDHDFKCNLTQSMSGVENAYLTVRAPNFTPFNQTACAKTTTSVIVRWSWPSVAEPDADGYVIYYSSESGSHSGTVKVEDGYTTEYTLVDLEPSTTYNIILRAYQDLLGVASGAMQVTTVPPEMTISHSLVQDISSTRLQYHVECLTSVYLPLRVSWFVNGELLDDDMIESPVLINEANRAYKYSAMVYVNITSSAEVTCAVSFTEGCDISKSVILTAKGTPPGNVDAEISSMSDISVMWSPPAGDNAILGYGVVYMAETLAVEQADTPSTYLSDVTQGSLYTISVFAYDSYLPTPLSNQVQLLFSNPGPVNELSGTVDSWHSISIDWNPPTLDGSFVSNYTLTYTATCQGSDETDSGGANFTADQTQATFLSLKGSLTYTFSVAAINPIGLSEFESITLTTEATTPTASPGNVTAEVIRFDMIVVNWGPVPCLEWNGEITGYVVRASIDGEVVANTSVGNANLATLTGLSPLQTYALSIAAVNSEGTGTLSSPIIVTTPLTNPGPVLSLKASDVNTTAITVSWGAPDTLGPLIDSYHIQYSTNCEDVSFNESLLVDNQTLSVELVDLEESSNYAVSVTASNSAGDGETMTIWHYTLPTAPSAAPPSVTAEAVSYDTIQVVWAVLPCMERNGLITGYVVDSVLDGETVSITSMGIATSATLTGLLPLKTYAVSVAAVNDEGTGPYSEPKLITTPLTIPGPVLSLEVVSMNATTITISWDAPVTLGPLIDIYYVEYNTSCNGGMPISKSLTMGNQTLSVELADVEEASNYTISVTARNSVGNGKTISIWHYTSPTAPATPPPNVTAKAVSYDMVRVAWGELSCLDRNGLITGYVVEVSFDDEIVNTVDIVDSSMTTTLTGLLPLRTYYVRVAAVTDQGIGPHSTELAVTTPLTIPGPVVSLETASVNATAIQVSWSPPDTLGPLIDSYLLRYRTTCQSVVINQSLLLGNQTLNVELTDVEEGSNYTISITASNSVGDGETISTWHLTSPTAPGMAPTSITAKAVSYDTVQIAWEELPCIEHNGNITGYIVNVSLNGELVTSISSLASTTDITVPDLLPLQTYSITIAAFNDQGMGPISSPVYVTTPLTVPGPVRSLSASIPQPYLITVSWSFPNTLGPVVDRYIVQYLTTCEDEVINKSLVASNQTRSVELANVSGASSYTIRVTAQNTIGNGETVSIVYNTPSFAPSASPDNVRAEVLSHDTVLVAWGTVPCQQRNGLITGFDINISTNGLLVKNVSVGVTTTANVTGLSPLQLYAISVAAVGEEGAGPHSSPQLVKTPLTVPGPVTSMRASTINTTTIGLSWEAPQVLGPLVDAYEIHYTTQCGEQKMAGNISVDNQTLSLELTALEEAQTYTISLTAENSLGSGETVTVLADTMSTIPSAAPSGVTVLANSNSSINITWSELDCFLGNGHIIGYKVSIVGRTDEFDLATQSENVRVDGLTEVAYEISIAAENGDGVGPYSDPFHFVLREVPGNVTSLTAESLDSTTVLVSWIAPSYQAAGITRYEVAYSQSASCSTDDFDELAADRDYVSAETLSVNITDLEASICYVFSVRAYSSEGFGDWVMVTETLLTPTTPALTQVSDPPLGDTEEKEPFYIIAILSAVAICALFILILSTLIMVLAVTWRRRKLRSVTMRAAFNQDASGDFKKSLELFSLSHGAAYAKLGPSHETLDTDGSCAELLDGYDYNTVAPKYQYRQQSPFDPQIPSMYPIPLPKLGSYVAHCHENDNEIFEQQFQELYSGYNRPLALGSTMDKKSLNRSKNIVPYADNRVILSDHHGREKIYMNASYIDGFTSAGKFIASQAPMKKTVNNFWRMVWQERPQSIAMITNLWECGKPKCEQYWPDTKGEEKRFGPFTVKLISEEVKPDIIMRKLKIWAGEDSSNFHQVTQFQFVSWPDTGIPEYPTPLLTLHKRVMGEWSPDDGPILVHCSLGVGRTGTFIALDLTLEQADQRGEVDIAGITNRLRQQRMKMVQTEVRQHHSTVLETDCFTAVSHAPGAVYIPP